MHVYYKYICRLSIVDGGIRQKHLQTANYKEFFLYHGNIWFTTLAKNQNRSLTVIPYNK